MSSGEEADWACIFECMDEASWWQPVMELKSGLVVDVLDAIA
jgi:hypothetical protein